MNRKELDKRWDDLEKYADESVKIADAIIGVLLWSFAISIILHFVILFVILFI